MSKQRTLRRGHKVVVWNDTSDVEVQAVDAHGRVVLRVPVGARRSTHIDTRLRRYAIHQVGDNRPIIENLQWPTCYLTGDAATGVDARPIPATATRQHTPLVLSVVAICALIAAFVTGGVLWVRRHPPRLRLSGIGLWNSLPRTTQVTWGH